MNCEFCGKPIADNESRCRYCGSVLVNQKTIEQTQYIKGSDIQRPARRSTSESTDDNTGVYPRTTEGFENSKRVRDEVNNRHNAAPVKRQYYRYNPNEMPKKNNVGRRRGSNSDYPKPARKKLKIGRTIGRFIFLAILGFVIGIAVYAVTINVSGWINDKKSDILESLPSATAAADNYGDTESTAEKSESTPTAAPTPIPDRSESSNSDNRSDNTESKNNTQSESKTESNTDKTQANDEYNGNEDKTASTEADSDSNNNNSADKDSNQSGETNTESGASSELED